ncbi:hypothetical protein [Mycolicibacterium cosmeticum]|uniref:hypothetical protein n=1 Tax=Mycolicibacterium cosmeticum TaxID=258533 RepID=UPI003204994C
MDCHICALYEAGDDDRAARNEAILHRRLLLAVLNGAADAVAEIRVEIRDCVPCLTRLAASFLTINATMVTASFSGDMEAAASAVQQVTLEYIDQQEPDAEQPPS